MIEWLSQNWLWLVVAIYLVGMMLYGHYIGFMRTALSTFTAVVAIVITRLLLPTITEWATGVFHLEDIPTVRLHILFFVGIFIIVMILLKLLIHATDVISNIPIIHGLNQIAGAILGAVLGLIFVWIACLVVTAFNETKWATDVIIRIQDSKFLTYIFDHNLIKTILISAIKTVL